VTSPFAYEERNQLALSYRLPSYAGLRIALGYCSGAMQPVHPSGQCTDYGAIVVHHANPRSAECSRWHRVRAWNEVPGRALGTDHSDTALESIRRCRHSRRPHLVSVRYLACVGHVLGRVFIGLADAGARLRAAGPGKYYVRGIGQRRHRLSILRERTRKSDSEWGYQLGLRWQ